MDSIRLDRVLLIVNSDSAQSLADAQDYATRRLTSERILAFNFGGAGAATTTLGILRGTTGSLVCQTAPYVGQSFMQALESYRAANQIDAIVCSTYTPVKVTGMSGGYSSAVYALASIASASHYMRFSDVPLDHFDPFVGNPTTIEGIVAAAPQSWRPVIGTFNARNPQRMLPHGRLGAGDFVSTNIAEFTLRGGATSLYANAVSQAAAGELLDHTSEVHCLTETLNYSIITAAKNKLAIDWGRQLAMPKVCNMGTDYSMTIANGGSITALAPMFAMCLATPFNVSPWTFGGNLADSFSCATGAWGFIWTSAAGEFGADLLYNGGAAAIMTGGEPLADGIPEPQDVFVLATAYQIPLALAHFLARGNGMGSTVCGDPLYAPYRATAVVPPKAFALPHR